jgi:SAM-dependent methyltransferase
MHETRFMPFQRELGGLGEADIRTFVTALADYCRFFRETFHTTRCDLPLATMLAHYVLYLKLTAWPRYTRLLEIGPGCGYLSFFLARDRKVETYAQIETTESFYLLQHLVNRYCFGSTLIEHAALDPLAARAIFLPNPIVPEEPRVTVPLPALARCHHWPWWRIADVMAEYFDIVTSNANLTEMGEDAVRQYAQLIGRALHQDGALIVQDMGGGQLAHEKIFQIFENVGLVPIAVVNPQSLPDRTFAVPTVVLARTDRTVHRADGAGRDGSLSAAHRVNAILPPPSGARREYSADEIGRLVSVDLAGNPGAGLC